MNRPPKDRNLMQFRQGMKVITADGKPVGTLARIVIDPKTKQITHVVLLQSSPLPEERTVPIHQIAESSLERLVLNLAAEQ